MMEARMLPDADSANVVGEIRGRELPDEFVVIGGHFDSWDVGTGLDRRRRWSVASWEALRMMKKLNLRPRRTVRVVLWTNEENGGRGGLGYRDQHLAELPNHVMMLESDGGVFRPTGFGFSGTDAGRARVRDIATLLAGIHAGAIGPSGGGADIGPSVQQAGIPALSLEVRRQLLPDPSHAGGHGRQDRPARDRPVVGGDRGDDLRDCGNAGKTPVVCTSVAPGLYWGSQLLVALLVSMLVPVFQALSHVPQRVFDTRQKGYGDSTEHAGRPRTVP